LTSVPLVTERPAERAAAGRSALAALTVSLAAALAAAGIAFAVWIGSPYFDGALDRAGSAAILGLPPAEVHALSRSVVTELFVGDGEFAQTIGGPGGQPQRAFSATEASHFRDVQVLARLLSVAILVALAILVVGVVRAGRQRWFWGAVARGAKGLAVGLVIVGIVFAVAFEPAFTLFHLIFFPGGNWSFDPQVARMVQLYPTPFWEEVVIVYALLAVGLAVVLWAVSRARARRLEQP
jgi:hypothetical protein